MALNTNGKGTQMEEQAFPPPYFFPSCVSDQSKWMGFGLDILNAWLIVLSLGALEVVL